MALAFTILLMPSPYKSPTLKNESTAKTVLVQNGSPAQIYSRLVCDGPN